MYITYLHLHICKKREGKENFPKLEKLEFSWKNQIIRVTLKKSEYLAILGRGGRGDSKDFLTEIFTEMLYLTEQQYNM